MPVLMVHVPVVGGRELLPVTTTCVCVGGGPPCLPSTDLNQPEGVTMSLLPGPQAHPENPELRNPVE